MANFKRYKQFVSVLIIIFTLLLLVFTKMEERRLGYVLLKENRVLRKLKDQNRLQVMEYARITRSERVRDLAVSRLTMNNASREQIIYLTGDKIAVAQ